VIKEEEGGRAGGGGVEGEEGGGGKGRREGLTGGGQKVQAYREKRQYEDACRSHNEITKYEFTDSYCL
jgi:hypothetical protein